MSRQAVSNVDGVWLLICSSFLVILDLHLSRIITGKFHPIRVNSSAPLFSQSDLSKLNTLTVRVIACFFFTEKKNTVIFHLRFLVLSLRVRCSCEKQKVANTAAFYIAPGNSQAQMLLLMLLGDYINY